MAIEVNDLKEVQDVKESDRRVGPIENYSDLLLINKPTAWLWKSRN